MEIRMIANSPVFIQYAYNCCSFVTRLIVKKYIIE